MENKTMNIMRSAMIGMAVGTALTAAGAIYIKENKNAFFNDRKCIDRFSRFFGMSKPEIRRY